jgi:hypothetical protein
VKNRNLRITQELPPPPFFNLRRGENPMDRSSLFGRLFFEINSMTNFGLFTRDEEDYEEDEDEDFEDGSNLFDNYTLPRFRVTQPRTTPTPRISPNSQGASIENPIIFDAPSVNSVRPTNVQNDGVVHIIDEDDDDDVLEVAPDGTIVIN